MKIEINNRTKNKINLALVKKVASAFGRKYKLGDKNLSVAFIGGAEMKKLNSRYRGQNNPTDILSFAPLNSAEGDLTGQAGEDDFLGELALDYSQVKRQAGEFGQTAERELVFILVHGLLHLIGYDDKTEAERKKMIKLGEEFIKKYLSLRGGPYSGDEAISG